MTTPTKIGKAPTKDQTNFRAKDKTLVVQESIEVLVGEEEEESEGEDLVRWCTRTEGYSSSLLRWATVLGAEIWLAAASWVALIAYFNAFYWHALNPRALGADYMGIGIYVVVMVVLPFVLEIPAVLKAMGSRVSFILSILLIIFLLWGDSADNERHRSCAFLIAMLCVGLRMVAIVRQPVPKTPEIATERSVAPWAVSLGLLLVVVCRMAFTTVHSLRETPAGMLTCVVISAVVLVLKAVLSHDLLSAPASAEDADIDEATCCGGCGASVTAGFLIPTLLMITLWILDAPWALAHFVGLYGSYDRFLYVMAFAAGIMQTLMLPWCSYGIRMSITTPVLLMVELVLGLGLLNVPQTSAGRHVAFVGALLVPLAMPGSWMLALHWASRSVQRCAAGRTLSLASFVFFIELLCYMGILTRATPVFGNFFWSKFWLFTLMLVVCLCGPFICIIHKTRKQKFVLIEEETYRHPEQEKEVTLNSTFDTLTPRTVAVASGSKDGTYMSYRSCAASTIWLALLVMVAVTLNLAAEWHSMKTPQQTERGLVVASYNIQQGYQLDGKTNFECLTRALQDAMPHVVGLQESDSVHVVSGNINPLGYIAEKLRWHRTVGPSGRRASVGVSILSQYDMSGKEVQQMPNDADAALNRFLVRSVINVNGTDVTVFNVHAEWFGNPALQVGFVADEVSKVKGPLVLVGDFNLDASGQNDATIAANITTNGFQKLLDLESTGLKSVTPINVGKCEMVTNGGYKYCPSDYTTVWMGAAGADTTPAYQLDYIWYRGLELIGDLVISEKSKGCSDHLLVKAAFVLP